MNHLAKSLISLASVILLGVACGSSDENPVSQPSADGGKDTSVNADVTPGNDDLDSANAPELGPQNDAKADTRVPDSTPLDGGDSVEAGPCEACSTALSGEALPNPLCTTNGIPSSRARFYSLLECMCNASECEMQCSAACGQTPLPDTTCQACAKGHCPALLESCQEDH